MKQQVAFTNIIGDILMGERCKLVLVTGETVHTSKVVRIGDNFIETQHTLYVRCQQAPIIDENLHFTHIDSEEHPLNQQVPQQVVQSVPQQMIQQPIQQPIQQYASSQEIKRPNEQLKEQLIQEMVAQQNENNESRVFQNRTEPEPPKKPKLNLNKADVATRLQVARSLKIISDVPSDKPGT